MANPRNNAGKVNVKRGSVQPPQPAINYTVIGDTPANRGVSGSTAGAGGKGKTGNVASPMGSSAGSGGNSKSGNNNSPAPNSLKPMPGKAGAAGVTSASRNGEDRPAGAKGASMTDGKPGGFPQSRTAPGQYPAQAPSTQVKHDNAS